MADRLRLDPLPPPWSYSVTGDGRIFFINDETQRTTWIHPVTEEPVETGLLTREDLPKGWQQGHTTEGAIYFVDHNKEATTFYHPSSSQIEVASDSQFHVKLSAENNFDESVKTSPKTEPTQAVADKKMVNKVPSTPEKTTSPATPKVKNRVIPKNVVPQVKRRKDDTVTMKGWLHKMGSKFKVWKKVWCVISDFCLFYYKGPNDVNMQGSIVLPSYDIRLVEYADKATKKYAFKCCHKNMRTVIFAAETQEDMKNWMVALSRAAKVQMDLGYGEPVNQQKEIKLSDDEDGGFANFTQPTQSEIVHNRSRNNSRHQTFEDDEPSHTSYDSRDDRDYGQPQSYHQQRSNGYMREHEQDRNDSNTGLLHPYHKDGSSTHEGNRNFIDESATEEESNKYSDNDIDEVYSEESRRNQTTDKDYHRLGTQPHTPGLYPVSYRTLPRKRSSDYYSSMDDFTWEESTSMAIGRSEEQEIQRRSAHDLRSVKKEEESQLSDGQSYRSSEELHKQPNKREFTNHSHHDPYRYSDSAHGRDDIYRHSNYERTSNRRYDSDVMSGNSLQHKHQSSVQALPQDNNQYSSRDLLSSSHLSSPSDVPQNYRRNIDGGSQHSYNPTQDDSGSQNSRDSQKRDELSSLQSYGDQRQSNNRPSSLRTASPSSNKDYVDGGHINRKRPDDLKFNFKLNSNYQRNDLASPEQRSVLQSPWSQDPPVLPKEQRSAINSPVTYNPPRPENDAQPLRDSQLQYKNKEEYPEQRSYLQSPLVQSNIQPSLRQEQRSTLNSPMVYEGNGPQWPSQSVVDHHSERITPIKTGSTHTAPSLSRSSTLDSKRPTSSEVRPGSRGGYTDEMDIAPTRNPMSFNSPPVNNEPYQRSFREDTQNDYNASGSLSRNSSRAGDYWQRERSADSYYGSQNGSRDPQVNESFDRNKRPVRKSSGYDSYSEDSQAELSVEKNANRSHYSHGNRGRDYSHGTRNYIPHNQIGGYIREWKERQTNGVTSREASFSSGQRTNERRKDYIPHDDARRKPNYHYDDDISSDSSSQQHTSDRRRHQQENKISASKQNYQESSPTKQRPESIIRAREEKEKQSRSSSRRTTQEIFESEGGDQFPSMEESNEKTQPRTTSRFRKWQQKLQPYIMLNTGTRVRLSISADDLLGKPHEELVLLLIQLRRDQANLRTMNDMIKTEMTKLTDPDLPADSPTKARARRHSLKNPSQDFTEEEMYLLELNQQKGEVQKELEISGPLVSLVDNLVRMGSLYGGQNEMLAQQYYRDEVKKGMSFKPPKKLIEFSRSFQEQRLAKDLQRELDDLETVEDRELEDKLSHLHFLDTRLQEISVCVTDLKEDKDKIEKALGSLNRQSRKYWDDPEAMDRIHEQQYRLERDLVKVRENLAYRTKELESITVENNRIEHEVKLLRTKMEEAKKRGSQSEADEMKKTRMQIERELQHVQGMIAGLENQKNALSMQMAGIRNHKTDNMARSRFDDSESNSSYTVTDLDSMQSYDISQDIKSQMNIPPPVLKRNESIGRVQELKKLQMASKEGPILQRHSTPVALNPAPALSPVLTPLRIETSQSNLQPYSSVNCAPSSLLTTSNTTSGSPALKDKKQTVRMRKRESERRKESDLRKKRSSSTSGRRSGTFDIRYDYKPKQKSGQKSLRRTASMPDRKSLMGELIVPSKQFTEEVDRGIVSDSEVEPKQFTQDLDLREFERAMYTADDEEFALLRSSSEHVLNSVSAEEFRIDDEPSGSLLGPPPKILIPERYNPLSDNDYEELTEEEKQKRAERAEGIKKMLTSHSFQEWHPREFLNDWQETTDNEEEMARIRQGLREEKEKRENILQMKANLAEEIKEQTKLIGAKSLKVSPHSTVGEAER